VIGQVIDDVGQHEGGDHFDYTLRGVRQNQKYQTPNSQEKAEKQVGKPSGRVGPPKEAKK